MVKRCQNIFIYVKKRLVWVVLDIEEIRDNDNETGLKERGGMEMSIYSAFHIRDARSLRFCIYLPTSSLVPGFVSDICDKYQFLGLYMPFLF